MNSVNLIGNVATDLKTVVTGNSKRVSLLLAVHRSYTSHDGVTADFVPLTAFGKTADVLAKYVNKGQQVAVSGSIKTGKYPDAVTGEVKYSWEVVADHVFLLSNRDTKPKQSPASQSVATDVHLDLPTDMANFPTRMSDM